MVFFTRSIKSVISSSVKSSSVGTGLRGITRTCPGAKGFKFTEQNESAVRAKIWEMGSGMKPKGKKRSLSMRGQPVRQERRSLREWIELRKRVEKEMIPAFRYWFVIDINSVLRNG